VGFFRGESPKKTIRTFIYLLFLPVVSIHISHTPSIAVTTKGIKIICFTESTMVATVHVINTNSRQMLPGQLAKVSFPMPRARRYKGHVRSRANITKDLSHLISHFKSL